MVKMSKAHFVLIAQAIKNLELDLNVKCYIAKCFAWNLQRTNENFDFDKFLKACVEDDK